MKFRPKGTEKYVDGQTGGDTKTNGAFAIFEHTYKSYVQSRFRGPFVYIFVLNLCQSYSQ
jgi:hypothetical protein